MTTGICDKCTKGVHDDCRMMVIVNDTIAFCSCHCSGSLLGIPSNEVLKVPRKIRKEFPKLPPL